MLLPVWSCSPGYLLCRPKKWLRSLPAIAGSFASSLLTRTRATRHTGSLDWSTPEMPEVALSSPRPQVGRRGAIASLLNRRDQRLHLRPRGREPDLGTSTLVAHVGAHDAGHLSQLALDLAGTGTARHAVYIEDDDRVRGGDRGHARARRGQARAPTRIAGE